MNVLIKLSLQVYKYLLLKYQLYTYLCQFLYNYLYIYLKVNKLYFYICTCYNNTKWIMHSIYVNKPHKKMKTKLYIIQLYIYIHYTVLCSVYSVHLYVNVCCICRTIFLYTFDVIIFLFLFLF